MKFLGKKFGPRDDDEDLDRDLDLESDPDPGNEDDLGSEDSEDKDAGGGPGLFSKFLRKRKGNDQDDEDPQEDATEDEDLPDPDDAPPVQRVQIEGVADVRPVGGAPGSLAPVTQPVEGGQAESPPATENSPQEQQESDENDDTAGEDSPQDDTDSDDDKDESGLGFSLKDLFEEAVEVDEALKDLADSQEPVAAADLARELREFLAELER